MVHSGGGRSSSGQDQCQSTHEAAWEPIRGAVCATPRSHRIPPHIPLVQGHSHTGDLPAHLLRLSVAVYVAIHTTLWLLRPLKSIGCGTRVFIDVKSVVVGIASNTTA